MKNTQVKNLITDIVYVLAASILYAVGINMFLEPHTIIIGGLTGIATVINAIIPAFPIGTGILLMNIPLLLICWKVIGTKFVVKTLSGIACTSVIIDILNWIMIEIELPIISTDPLISGIFGGICVGIAIALLLSRGFNTGGSDMAVILLRRKLKHIPYGKILMVFDGIVVLASAFILDNIMIILYSVITIIAETLILDYITVGFDRGKIAFICSGKHEEVAKALTDELERGITMLDSTGWYTKNRGYTLMCAIRPREVWKLKNTVKEIDPNAFIIFGDASEVAGLGFDDNEHL
ncbi:MAG: YitT family protein [Ruminococcaceae bacterium]|nr:YitT family protein [Oscillospiraceae bacterium]